MSEAAVQERAGRQRRAAPGGRQDRLLRGAKIALPAAAGVLVAVLATAPLTQGREISFLLDKNKVDVAPERMRVEAAQYRGQDNDGQPFSVTAGAAVQRVSTDPVVRMSDLAARIRLKDGPASIMAGKGRYDLIQERVAVDGPVKFDAPDGYQLTTRDVVVDLKTRTMASDPAASGGRIEGRMPLGTFSAERMRADMNARHVVLDGRVRLKIVQGAIK